MTSKELEAAFKAHSGELRQFLRRKLQNPEAAADLAQEAYARLLRQPPAKPVSNLRAFIFRIGRNLAIDHVRSRDTREHLDQGLEYLYEVTGDSPELFNQVAAQQDLQALAQGIEQLPPLARLIFTLARLEGLPHKDIALQLDISLSSVEKHLAAALDFLRRKLQR
ncbi:RNA polymerase sigma factor [Pseudomonas tructae]|nr:RNA polymerase sigma factor [Pseudomonas tructae]